MKNQKIFRSLFNGTLLVCTLALLSACLTSKKCPTCEPELEVSKPEDVLLSIDGVPVITVQKFNDFYEFASANAGYPLSKNDAFNTLESMEILKRELKKTGKTEDSTYKKNLSRARDYAEWGVNNQVLIKEIEDSIDISDAGLEKFYNENKGKNPNLDRPPFLKSPESIRIQEVDFNDQKSAQDFLAKAKNAKDSAAFAALAKGISKTVKDLGNVSPQTQGVDFSIKLNARTINPNESSVVTLNNGKFAVIRAGSQRQPAQYLTFAELIALPQMREALGAFRKRLDVEPEFMKRIEEFKKGFKIEKNDKYFEEEEAKKKAEDDKLKELLQKKEEAPAAQQPKAVAPKVA
jgi:hypothetical protein